MRQYSLQIPADAVELVTADQANAEQAAPGGFWGWWEQVEESNFWKNYSFYGLAVAFLALFLYALIQFNRLTPTGESGAGTHNKWTIQNIFHLVIVVVTGIRSAEFFLDAQINNYLVNYTEKYPYRSLGVVRLFYDLPGLLFYNAYTTCVLFYAYVFHQLQGYNILQSFRPIYLVVNAFIYFSMIGILVGMIFAQQEDVGRVLSIVSSVLMALLALLLAVFYLLYGCRLYFLLKRFPIETRGRRRKMREVFQVTLICTVCFVLRFSFILISTCSPGRFELDTIDHPLLNIFFYAVCEIIPTVWVFAILRKAPPRPQQQLQQQHSQLSGQPLD